MKKKQKPPYTVNAISSRSVLDFKRLSDKPPKANLLHRNAVTVSAREGFLSSSSGAWDRHRTRADQPPVCYSSGGSSAHAIEVTTSSPSTRKALDELERDVHARTSHAPRNSRWATWRKFHVAWFGDESFIPLTRTKLLVVSSMFKAGKYVSFAGYLSRAKEEHTLAGHEWNALLQRTEKDCRRSVTRGLSSKPASAPFDFEKVMDKATSPVAISGSSQEPFEPATMICIGTLFLCREIELSGALASEMWINLNEARLYFMLPASKTDSKAKGTIRSLDCGYTLGIASEYISESPLEPLASRVLKAESPSVLTVLKDRLDKLDRILEDKGDAHLNFVLDSGVDLLGLYRAAPERFTADGKPLNLQDFGDLFLGPLADFAEVAREGLVLEESKAEPDRTRPFPMPKLLPRCPDGFRAHFKPAPMKPIHGRGSKGGATAPHGSKVRSTHEDPRRMQKPLQPFPVDPRPLHALHGYSPGPAGGYSHHTAFPTAPFGTPPTANIFGQPSPAWTANASQAARQSGPLSRAEEPEVQRVQPLPADDPFARTPPLSPRESFPRLLEVISAGGPAQACAFQAASPSFAGHLPATSPPGSALLTGLGPYQSARPMSCAGRSPEPLHAGPRRAQVPESLLLPWP
eukprot:s1421_g14.t2